METNLPDIYYAREIDLVEFLEQLGYFPNKIRGRDYWYLSPLRHEKTPSFKVNRKLNLWYDHGIGEGGTVADFGTRYFHCSLAELPRTMPTSQFFNKTHYDRFENGSNNPDLKGKIVVVDHREIGSTTLGKYLCKRGIASDIAHFYCREIDFQLYDKKHTAIGFGNIAGGYELRNEYFKGSSAPKDISFLNNGGGKLLVFEGFFDFLSFQTLKQQKSQALIDLPEKDVNFLILNTLSFFQKYKSKMEQHCEIHLFLDRDEAGLRCSEHALRSSNLYINQNFRYKQFKDLNDFLTQNQDPKKKKISLKKHFF
ncbi:MAG: toprim domain-containing protein [Flavisolibacter sp.]